MSEFARMYVKDRIAVVAIDNPPVNALAEGVREAILERVGAAAIDPGVDAIVLIGHGSTFVAGADIKVFDALRSREQSIARSARVHALLNALEDTPKPIVAAIHGHALGGGLELAMACHYRVASADARLGQPEVQLGIIPGAGGTQRLPRLVGGTLAVQMCTDGKPLGADAAAAAGLVDAVAPADLVDAAIAFAKARAAAGERRMTRQIVMSSDVRAAGLAAATAAQQTFADRPGSPATRLAAEAIAAAMALPFEQGLVRERELFAECVVSTESRALRHLFFAEREAARPPADAQPTLIQRAAVIGAGTMGVGIAMCYASAGIPVRLHDADDGALQRALTSIRRNYESSVAKGRITRSQYEAAMSAIVPTTSLADVRESNVIVEAVFENMALKRQIFQTLGEITPPECILASNPSTLDIDELAAASGRPDRVVGHHFFSPANVMKLLEIVRGRETSADVIASSLAIGKRLGKVCAVVGNWFGFVANRLLAYYMREAYLLLEEGASVEAIDRAVVQFGLPVGPFAMQDIAGIDVGTRIRQHLAAMGKTRADGPQSEVPDRLFDLGRYGQKTSAGWYRYEAGSRTPIPDPLIGEIAAAAAARRGISRRAHNPADQIIARISTAIVNEGLRVLDEGFAARAGDIDVIYCYGFGFPRYRGGPMFYAETIGLSTVLERVHRYRAVFGDYWKPAPLLERLVAEGRSLSDAAPALA
jgi:3-hydroxyacyl-CoA dehydrogenase